MRKVLVAGLLSGVVVFLWGMLSHMALGLGEVGVSRLPKEAAVTAAIQENVPEAGLYIFPGEPDPDKWAEAYRTSPHGILVASPAGSELVFGRLLGMEFATNVLGGLLLAWMITAMAAGPSWKTGALAGLAMGFFAHLGIDASYAIWYNFPWGYTVAQALDHLIAWGLAGAVAGVVLRRR